MKRLHILFTFFVVAMLVTPVVADAQVRGRVGVRVASPRVGVVVGGGYYRPYYRPYYGGISIGPYTVVVFSQDE